MLGLGVWEIDAILILVVLILAAGRLSEFGGARRRSRARTVPVSTPRRPIATAAPAPAAPARAVPSPTIPTLEGQALAAAGQAVPPPGAPPPVTAGEPVLEVENKCSSCNTINPPGQVFCGQCGMRLTRAA